MVKGRLINLGNLYNNRKLETYITAGEFHNFLKLIVRYSIYWKH